MNKDIEDILSKSEIIYIRQSKYSKEDWHSALHSHYFSEILIVLSGEGNFIVEDRNYPIKKNDVIIVNPYVQHTETSSSDFPLWYVVIGINNIKFEKSAIDNHQHFIYHDHMGELVPLLKLAISELNGQSWGYESALKRIAEMLLIRMYRQQNFTLISVKNKSVSKDSVLVKDFIDSHFKEQFDLEDISAKVHLDKYYIIHTFKQNYNTTPMNYLMKKRIESASELLESTDFQIADIASITGFSSQSYFNQAFKREMNISPLKYRKRYREIN